jgi:hypothetical protein
MDGRPINERPVEYVSISGITFRCKRADFAGHKIRVSGWEGPYRDEETRLMQAVADFIGFHAMNIHPALNGFAGYDTIHFEFGD